MLEGFADLKKKIDGFCLLDDGWAYLSTRRSCVLPYWYTCCAHLVTEESLEFISAMCIMCRFRCMQLKWLLPTCGRSILPPCHLGWGRPLGFPFSAGWVSRKPCRDWYLKRQLSIMVNDQQIVRKLPGFIEFNNHLRASSKRPMCSPNPRDLFPERSHWS